MKNFYCVLQSKPILNRRRIRIDAKRRISVSTELIRRLCRGGSDVGGRTAEAVEPFVVAPTLQPFQIAELCPSTVLDDVVGTQTRRDPGGTNVPVVGTVAGTADMSS